MELTREHYRAKVFYDFNAELNQDECYQRLQLAFGEESPCRATIFRWFKEFFRGRNSLQDGVHTEKPRSVVSPGNVSALRKMLMDDNHCTYQIIQKELDIKYATVHKIIHGELHMKKVVCRWVPHNLTEHQKKRSVSESIKTLKLLNDGGHRIIS
ncbi:UNVERIFIED_CONTAM: Histone-lysine N-methyltransferase SETMAR [Trichonephila clavipes]